MRKYCNQCGMAVEFTEYRGENSHAVLRGNSHAVLWENSHAQCKSPYACGILKSITAKCIGRHIGDKSLSTKTYLSYCGVTIHKGKVILHKGKVILYKSVTNTLKNGRDGTFQYVIGQEAVAPDWDANSKDECGKGLHLSPSPAQAAMFYKNGEQGVFLACEVKVTDIAPLPAFAEMPDKIRVRACIPLYQVNEQGEKI